MAKRKQYILDTELGSKIFRIIMKHGPISGSQISKLISGPRIIYLEGGIKREVYHVHSRTYNILNELRNNRLIETTIKVENKENANKVNFKEVAKALNDKLIQNSLTEYEINLFTEKLADNNAISILSVESKISYLDEMAFLLNIIGSIWKAKKDVPTLIKDKRVKKVFELIFTKDYMKAFNFMEIFMDLPTNVLERFAKVKTPITWMDDLFYNIFWGISDPMEKLGRLLKKQGYRY